jgi:hypothetical protein
MKPTNHKNISAAAKNPVLWISLFVMALFAALSVTRAQTGADADVVTAISNLENDAVKVDLAGDTAFTRKFWLRIGPGAIAMEPGTPKPMS